MWAHSVGLGGGAVRWFRSADGGAVSRIKGTREGRGFGRRTLYRPVCSLIVPYTSSIKF